MNRLSSARDKWTPRIGHVLGIRPWEMELLTVGEYHAIVAYLDALAAEAEALAEAI